MNIVSMIDEKIARIKEVEIPDLERLSTINKDRNFDRGYILGQSEIYRDFIRFLEQTKRKAF